jgi:hypothetical protein
VVEAQPHLVLAAHPGRQVPRALEVAREREVLDHLAPDRLVPARGGVGVAADEQERADADGQVRARGARRPARDDRRLHEHRGEREHRALDRRARLQARERGERLDPQLLGERDRRRHRARGEPDVGVEEQQPGPAGAAHALRARPRLPGPARGQRRAVDDLHARDGGHRGARPVPGLVVHRDDLQVRVVLRREQPQRLADVALLVARGDDGGDGGGRARPRAAREPRQRPLVPQDEGQGGAPQHGERAIHAGGTRARPPRAQPGVRRPS